MLPASSLLTLQVLRGDKGAKAEQAVTHGEYLRRAIRLARPQWRIFAAAFSFLLVAGVLGNLMPHYQGLYSPPSFLVYIVDVRHGFVLK